MKLTIEISEQELKAIVAAHVAAKLGNAEAAAKFSKWDVKIESRYGRAGAKWGSHRRDFRASLTRDDI